MFDVMRLEISIWIKSWDEKDNKQHKDNCGWEGVNRLVKRKKTLWKRKVVNQIDRAAIAADRHADGKKPIE